ncbi:hypothetical protein QYE76_056241 [Lolium multiflorum]|uniref:F-box domain-containing protein n=1 Tax=Lolium multiflorum TaxID=4521 RepID=A0AAD8T189_LOLMU|nr:hypothetical protein QYE76_056241 [Lolium multiflorum]
MGNNNVTGRPRRILDDARREGVATVLITCRCNRSLICHCKPPRSKEEITLGAEPGDAPSGGRRKPTRSRTTRTVPIGNLPEELLPAILSKLDAKQAARTSVLSSAWEHAWKHSPRLTLDIFAICGAGYMLRLDHERYVQRFLDMADAILRQRRGSVVEQLEIRVDEAAVQLVSRRLDDWVRFAAAARAKSLTLHVSSVTPCLMRPSDLYALPLQLLDDGGVSGLHHIHLSCVSLKLPSPSFPKLKRLGLCYARVSAADFGDMLSNCPNLEWLDLYHVYLNDELKVDTPFSRLRYLRLAACSVTQMKLTATNLATFIFLGRSLPSIDLGATPRLCDVNVYCHEITMEHALSSLSDAFPMVQRLSFHSIIIQLEFPWRLQNASRFPHLRHLQLIFDVRTMHSDDILSVVRFLEAAPLLEELDIVLALCRENGGEGHLRRLPHGQLKYKCLKSLRVCSFRGQKSQVDLLVHIVENAPALQILTIDSSRPHVPEETYRVTEDEKGILSKIRHMAATCIGSKLSAKTKFIVE